jgi:hypothetical protein
MFLYIELWKPRSTWNALPCEQREESLSQLKAGLKRMEHLGVELVGIALCDEETPNNEEYRYMAVWKMPNLGHVHMLETAVRKEGWSNYFDMINARGKMIPVNEFVGDMVKV